MATQIIYFFNSVLTKSSFLLLYYRIFGVVQYFRWVLYASAFLVIAYFVACTLAAIFGCWPVAKFWNPSLPGHCVDEVSFFRWSGIANILLDVLILCLPYPMAWRLQTTLRQKLTLSGLFLLGGL
ncbi:hypothetical protein N7468_009231 [Penicillium chermesinum]|uniref:Rhodopsin domain-containing protein n=1 Tax=Penicillium chermesinum TaxID=63820 RepID=A0A9W9NHL7_9EURO|nr:uncharacterized protein N7468_009231 [Penicillium chermesinum]KAJ5220027.1 hypothetical protein N7468_009231 [Penicillium chermesinum]KAJ6157480.1 hypothetical protein N7470_005072 [Penicillium chermesinum]